MVAVSLVAPPTYSLPSVFYAPKQNGISFKPMPLVCESDTLIVAVRANKLHRRSRQHVE
jgi:hypothetical protein